MVWQDVYWSQVLEQYPVYRILFAMMLVFMSLVVCIPLVSLFLNWLRHFRRRRLNRQVENCKADFFAYLSDPENPPIVRAGVGRKAPMELLYRLMSYVKGRDMESLEHLYALLGLDAYLERKLQSPWVLYKSFYLNRMSVFPIIPNSVACLERLVHHSCSTYRLYALKALIAYQPERMQTLFLLYRYPLTLWEQADCYDFLISRRLPVPDFHLLALSTNDSIALFGIRMVRMFHQKQGTVEGYELLLTHPNKEIQFEMFRTLAEFGYRNIPQLMGDFLPGLPMESREHALSFLSKTEVASVSLMMQYYEMYEDESLRLHLLYCLYNNVPGGKQVVENYAQRAEDENLNRLSNHLLKNILL